MYEVTVSTPNEQEYLLDYVSTSTQSYIDTIGGICTNLQQKNRSYFSVACSDTFGLQAQKVLKDTIVEVLSVGYKNLFVRNLLGVTEGNFYQNVLVDTMCVFDHQFDASMLASIVDVTKDIYLDGYYLFGMQNIKHKWENIANMILENNYILGDNELILEFLQYLLQSADSKVKQLSICIDCNSYTLYDDRNKVIANSITLSPQSTIEQQAIVNAFNLNPQTVKVYHNQMLSPEFLHVAKSLFDIQYVNVS